MQLRRDFLIALGFLVFLNLVLAFGSIALLTRMSPAIRDILEENVVSIEAAETMMSSLIGKGVEPGTEESARSLFSEALARAKRNVTEPDEDPVLASIGDSSHSALEGDSEALISVKKALLDLTRINRQAMLRADEKAQRLGTAGAWAAAFLALTSLVISLVIIRRLDDQIIRPWRELSSVLQSILAGEVRRRCRISGFSSEVRRIFESLNTILDRYLERTDDRVEESARKGEALLYQEALTHFLGTYGRAAVIVDHSDRIVSSNQEAVMRLSDPEGVAFRKEISQLAEVGEAPGSLEAIRLGSSGWLAVRKRSVR